MSTTAVAAESTQIKNMSGGWVGLVKQPDPFWHVEN